MFGMIQEQILWPHIHLETTLRLKSRKNKYADQGSTQVFIPLEPCTTYAFYAGLFHISVFLPFLSHACHVWQAQDRYSGIRLHDRYFTHARLLDNGRQRSDDKMFILKVFTPLQAPGCLPLSQIDS